MPKFRKRPVVIEAVQWTGLNRHEVLEFIGEHGGHWSAATKFVPERLAIYTREGQIYALLGDWIIRGVASELYPCKPDIFAATYDPEGASDGE